MIQSWSTMKATAFDAVSVGNDVVSFDSTLEIGLGKAEREEKTKFKGKRSFPAQAKNRNVVGTLVFCRQRNWRCYGLPHRLIVLLG
jgi:hypothetical protein